MDTTIFRAYSIRGLVNKTLTAEDMYLIGQGAGTVLAGQGIVRAVVGRDARTSSPALSAALIEGLLSTGLRLIDVGVCPTPLLNWATDYYRAGAGLMVTASHNPADYNGLKIRTDHSLGGEELMNIYRVIQERRFKQGRGSLIAHNPTEDYLKAVASAGYVERPLWVAIDAGNGVAGDIAVELVERLGCAAIPIFCKPDGRFPNRVPDPTAPGALAALSAQVVEAHAHVGVAYDGDGDRLAMVDEQGNVVFGDQLLALLARQELRKRPGGRVVYEVSCTQAVPETVAAAGGVAIPCPVGYAFVHQAMRQHGAILGGEAAGHLFFDHPGFAFDDAMLATAKVLTLLNSSQRPFSALLAELPRYYLSPEYRFKCPDDLKTTVVERVRAHFAALKLPIERMDGARVDFGGGWALFRCSNTQPAVTLRCEAKTGSKLAEIEETMLDVVRRALADAGVDMQSAH